MGKTKTIKKRAIYVYLPSIEMTERWKCLADKAGVSISKFVIENVENSLLQETEEYKPRRELLKEINDLKKNFVDANLKINRQDIVIEKLQEELRRYRAQPFIEEDYSGIRTYNKKLVEILKEAPHVKNEIILSRLGIKSFETDAVKAISKQLGLLESYGLVKATPGGWRWVDES